MTTSGFWLGSTIVTAVSLMLAWLYLRGWRRLRRTLTHPDADLLLPVSRHALITFMASLLLLAFTLIILHPFTHRYFSAHVVQHLLLAAWIPGLFWVSDPLIVLYVGLPSQWRRPLRPYLHPTPSTWQQFVGPGPVLILFMATFWLWYDPAIHQARLAQTWLRPLEIISILTTALLYWWHIMAAHPRLHIPMPPLVRIGYAAIGAWPIKIVGLIVLFSGKTIYQYPNTWQFTGLDLNDQAVGGILIWVVGGFVFTFTATMLMRRWLAREEMKPTLPISEWATEEALKAPHRQ